MAEFLMPSLGADMTEGTLLQWLVHPGDPVHRGDVVAEVDTTKAAVEVECFDDGIIGAILVPQGRTVPVGTPLATIEPIMADGAAHAADGAGKLDTATPRPSPLPEEHPAAVPEARPPTSESTAEHEFSEIRATPLIRRLAEEAGIDLAAVHGSGPGGRVMRADVEQIRDRRDTASPSVSVAASDGRVPAETGGRAATRRVRASGYARRLAADLGIDLAALTGTGTTGAVRAADVRAAHAAGESGIGAPVETGVGVAAETVIPHERREAETHHDPAAVRRLIAAAMTRSKQTVPHYYLSSTIDMDAAVRWLRETNRTRPVAERVLSPALLLRATARAARMVPELNGHWIDDEFRPAADVDLGMVVSLRGGGIIVPTIPRADRLPVVDIMRELRGVVSRARDARLRSSDATAATLTVTNLGDLGVDSVFGVIAAPQVAIVGFGNIAERPCAVNGLLGVRAQVTATLSADHRASDGAVGARFLNTVADLLQRPEEL